MRVRLGLTLVLIAAALVAGCGGGDEEGEAALSEASCGSPPAALSGTPELPDGFPTPTGVTYTESREAGPSTIVSGYREEGLEDTFEAYKAGFEDAGYEITKDEREERDAEVNFEGPDTDGQVRLRDCADRTAIEITIRPL